MDLFTLSQYFERCLPKKTIVFRSVVLMIIKHHFQHRALYVRRYRTRKHLTRLTAAQLIDVGLSVKQAKIESNTPFWK